MVRPEVTWWLVFGIFMLQQSDGCDERVNISHCTCSFVPVGGQTKIKVDCSGQGLRSVPGNLPRRTILDFSNNSLQTSHVETLCRYADLEHVSIANNDLKSIIPGSLQLCKNAKSVNLSGNILDVVASDTFYGLEFADAFYGLESMEFKDHACSKLDLFRNIEIVTYQSSIPVNLFSGSKLNTLSLDIRGATEVPAAILQPITETLTKLSLTSTSVQSLDGKLLLNMKSLREITLHLTLIQSIPVKFFQHSYLYNSLVTITIFGVKTLQRKLFQALESLRHLAIYGADVMSAELFRGLPGLETLDLSGYVLIYLPPKWFNDLRSLKELVLRKTGLSKITRKDFLHLEQIQTLDLSSNSITALQPELFYEISLNVLLIDLSYNNLKVFPRGLFNQEAVLVELNLSSNKINSIEEGCFNNLTKLRRLYLQGNTLYNIEADTFINNVNMAFLDLSFNILIDLPARLFQSTRNLTDLDLSNNRINKLEQSINFYVASLRIVNVSYNPIHCDCKIVQVKNRLSHVILIGDCVKPQPGIAISDFVPETNCSTIDENDIDIFDANVSSPGDYTHPTESIVDASGLDKQVIKEVNSTSFWTESSEVKTSTIIISTEHLKFSESENETKSNIFTWAVETFEKSEDNLVTETYEPSIAPKETKSYYVITTQNSESSELQPSFTAFESVLDSGSSLRASSISLATKEELGHTLRSTIIQNFTNVDKDHGHFSISPTRAVTEKGGIVDNMAGENRSIDDVLLTEVTKSPFVERSLNNVTSKLEKEISPEKDSDYFHISLAAIISVAVISLLILVFLYCKRRRSTAYEVTNNNFGYEFPATGALNDDRSQLTPLKEVPAIQIESVDDEGNIRVEMYPLAQTNDTWKN